jgi:hypothetical protein
MVASSDVVEGLNKEIRMPHYLLKLVEKGET